MARADPYADIDFDEVTEATGLAVDEIKCLKVRPFYLINPQVINAIDSHG
jgi:hypothetical protein